MPKHLPHLPKGGQGKKSPNPRRPITFALGEDVRRAILALPQIQSGAWSRSYLVDAILREWLGLGLPSEIPKEDLEKIRKGETIIP